MDYRTPVEAHYATLALYLFGAFRGLDKGANLTTAAMGSQPSDALSGSYGRTTNAPVVRGNSPRMVPRRQGSP